MTPALVLDLDALERNIATMAAWAKAGGRALRPHGKSHKSPHIARLQAAAGAVVAALWLAATGRGGAAWSALYGAAAVVLPAALMARGIPRRLSGAAPGALVLGFLFWEAVKIALAVAMLAAAVKIVPDLSWPALLVSMVVCMKVSWLALLWRGRVKQTS